MVQEIVFHLGDCKTGTTSIQSALSDGRFSVTGKSYVYPARLNNNPMADALRGKVDAADRDAKWTRLSRKILRSDKDIAIVSAENFEFVPPKRLAAIIETHFSGFQGRMRFITYVRPHAERLISSFAERSKQGKFTGDMAEAHAHFLSTGLLIYRKRLDRWRNIFGDALEIRPMIRSRLRNGDVVQDFLDFAFQGAEVEIDKSASVNESLTLADLLALRRLHQRIAESPAYTDERMRAVGWNLASLIATLPKPAKATKPQMHRQLAAEVREAYREDAQSVDEAYFQGTPLSDALDRIVEPALAEPQSLAIEAYFSEDALRVIDGFALLLRRLLEADPRHFRMAVRPESLRASRFQGESSG